VTLFRRREPLHVRLAREGALELGESEPRPPWDAPGIHGLPRVREWDLVTTVADGELVGERASFVCVAPGRFVIEEGPSGVGRLAAAVETGLKPPFRAEAVRRDGGLWAVAARKVELVSLPSQPGEEIELTSHLGHRTLLVDGERSFGSVPELERSEHVVRAHRLEGELWEVEIASL
jgi:hypothetical protein